MTYNSTIQDNNHLSQDNIFSLRPAAPSYGDDYRLPEASEKNPKEEKPRPDPYPDTSPQQDEAPEKGDKPENGGEAK